MGFEPTTPISRGNRLAGGRTRPLCDPSGQTFNILLLCKAVCHESLSESDPSQYPAAIPGNAAPDMVKWYIVEESEVNMAKKETPDLKTFIENVNKKSKVNGKKVVFDFVKRKRK